MTITRAFQRGETVPIWAEVETWLGVAASPSQGLKVTITNPSGDIKPANGVAVAMTETPAASGKYVYYYASASDDEVGWWRYKVVSQDGTGATAKYTTTWGGFRLE